MFEDNKEIVFITRSVKFNKRHGTQQKMQHLVALLLVTVKPELEYHGENL